MPSNVNVTGSRTAGAVGANVNSAVGAADAIPAVENTVTSESSSARARVPSALTCVASGFMCRLSVSAQGAVPPVFDDRGLDGALSYRRLAIRLQVFARSFDPQWPRGRSSFLFREGDLGATDQTTCVSRVGRNADLRSGRASMARRRFRRGQIPHARPRQVDDLRQRRPARLEPPPARATSVSMRHGAVHKASTRTTVRRPARHLAADRPGRGRGPQRPRPADAVLAGPVPAAGGAGRPDRDAVRHRGAGGGRCPPAARDHLGELPGAPGRGRPRRRVHRGGRRAADVDGLRPCAPRSHGSHGVVS